MNKIKLKISVKNLVNFVYKSGDLRYHNVSLKRALQGTLGHQTVQNSRIANYEKEVSLVFNVEFEGIVLEIKGRMDGVFHLNKGVIIEEIKTTTIPLANLIEDFNKLHWAQVLVYSYIYSVQNNLKEVGVQLTYHNLETQKNREFIRKYKFSELEEFFTQTLEKYLTWAKMLLNQRKERDISIKKLKFPFDNLRDGQNELMGHVENSIKNGEQLFAEAATGIGKTISVIYPAIKGLEKHNCAKIFYLTAKTIGRMVAYQALDLMNEKGLKSKSVIITAKDKICFNPSYRCDPEKCKYAKGHFDRVNDAILEIYNEPVFDRDIITEISFKHRVCPFELSLDLALWADVVICDYNYVFDPIVNLRRFFESEQGKFIVCIDEAHNLVDRAREMYSAELFKQENLDFRKVIKDAAPEIYKITGKINLEFLKMKKECEKSGSVVSKELPQKFINVLRVFLMISDNWFEDNKKAKLKDFVLDYYFQILKFVRISEYFSDHFVSYYEKNGKELKIKIYCIDPGDLLKISHKKSWSTIFFSATLTPMTYFKSLLGGDEKGEELKIASPFPIENFKLLIQDKIATTYKKRNSTLELVKDTIKTFVSGKKGNYLIFFPSYKYMEDVVRLLPNEDFNIMVQQKYMTEPQRENFLEEFDKTNGKSLLGFVVMGGIFGEGIDLMGDNLIGAVVVGVGLPQVCLERNLIKEYYDQNNKRGFPFAYTYPGFIRVLQASGRVIRSDDDKGMVLLIDQRFSYTNYKKLFPEHWSQYRKVKYSEELKWVCEDFWE
jgi:DNA excision repair protein ERCC-2